MFFSLPDALLREPCKTVHECDEIVKQAKDALASTFMPNDPLIPTILTAFHLANRNLSVDDEMVGAHMDLMTSGKWLIEEVFGSWEELVGHSAFVSTRQMASVIAGEVTRYYRLAGLGELIKVPKIDQDTYLYPYQHQKIALAYKLGQIEVGSDRWNALPLLGKRIVLERDTLVIDMYAHAIDKLMTNYFTLEEIAKAAEHNDYTLTVSMNAIGIMLVYTVTYIHMASGSIDLNRLTMTDGVVKSAFTTMARVFYDHNRAEQFVSMLYNHLSAAVLFGLLTAFPNSSGELLFGPKSFLRRMSVSSGQDATAIIRLLNIPRAQLEDLQATIRAEIDVWVQTGECTLISELDQEAGRAYRMRIIDYWKQREEWWHEQESDIEIRQTLHKIEDADADPETQARASDDEPESQTTDDQEPSPELPLVYESHVALTPLTEVRAFLESCIPLPFTSPWRNMPRKNTPECGETAIRMRSHVAFALQSQDLTLLDPESIKNFCSRPGGMDFLTALVRDIYHFARELCGSHRIPSIEIGHAVFLWRLMMWAEPTNQIPYPSPDVPVWTFQWAGANNWFIVVASISDNPSHKTLRCKRASDAYDRQKRFALMPEATQVFGSDFDTLLHDRPVAPESVRRLLIEQVDLRLAYYTTRCATYAGTRPVLHGALRHTAIRICDVLIELQI